MKSLRQGRSSSLYTTKSQLQNSQANQYQQMTSSKALIHNPLRNSNMRNRANSNHNSIMNNSNISKGRSMLPQIPDQQQNDKEYISKLHEHIQFLNQSIVNMKQGQTDYKSQMMNMMMPKDDNKIVDHAIMTQQKFKGMKQQLVQQIHVLQNEYVQIQIEIEALKNSKKYLEDECNQADRQDYQKMEEMKLNLEKAKNNFTVNKERREEKDDIVFKLQDDVEKLRKDHFNICLLRKNKLMEDGFDEELYNKEYEIYEKDLEQKREELKEILEVIDKCNQKQEQDKEYKQMKEKQERLKEQLQEEQKQRDINQYECEVLEQTIKFNQMRKDEMMLEQQNLKSELEKYKQMKEEIDKRNSKRIENYIEKYQSEDSRQYRSKFEKLKKQARDLKEKQEKIEKDFREMSKFISQKELRLQQINEINADYQRELEKVYADYNSLKDRHDELQANITEDVEKEKNYKIDFENLERKRPGEEEVRIYLKTIRDGLQDKVKLEEEMRKVKVEQLKNITFDNQQFNNNVNNFYQNWGNMYQFGRQSQA